MESEVEVVQYVTQVEKIEVQCLQVEFQCLEVMKVQQALAVVVPLVVVVLAIVVLDVVVLGVDVRNFEEQEARTSQVLAPWKHLY